MKQFAIYIGIILLIVAGIFGLSKLDNAPQKSSPTLPAVSKKDVTVGNKQAKTVVVEYSDFQCPACATYDNFVNQLLKDYDGKILFVYRFFPLTSIHKNANLSSQAAWAANLQGKFKEMKSQLFNHQNDWGEKNNARDIFIEYAKTIGLDTDKFQKDMDSNDTKKVISDSENSALTLGINSTPTFFINGTQQSFGTYQELKQLIETELKK